MFVCLVFNNISNKHNLFSENSIGLPIKKEMKIDATGFFLCILSVTREPVSFIRNVFVNALLAHYFS